MTVSLGTVVCTVADSTGTVSIPPSVMAAFQPGDTCYVELTRTARIAANVTVSSFTAEVQ